MSYEIYKIIHLIGIVLLFSGLSSFLVLKIHSNQLPEGKVKSFIFITHGVGLLFMLVSGFGLLARLGLTSGLPHWIYVKLLIWLALGAAVAVIKRKKQIGWAAFFSLLIIFTCAAYLALYKPF